MAARRRKRVVKKRKKAVSRRRPARKKAVKRKVTKKRTTRKKVTKKRVTKRKVTRRKPAARRKVAKKRVAKKRVAKKKPVKRKPVKKRVAPKRGKPTPLKRVEETKERKVGSISHFFSRIGVGVLEVKTGSVTLGDKIRVKGNTTDFIQIITSMQRDHEQVNRATRGQSIGIKVDKEVRRNDKVYIL